MDIIMNESHYTTKQEWLDFIFVLDNQSGKERRLAFVARMAARGDIEARDAVKEASKRIGRINVSKVT